MIKGKEAQIKQIKPTLVIGLGGTGQHVLTQLKARLIHDYGRVPRPVEFLAFDTDPSYEVEAGLPAGPVRLQPGVELHNIGNIRAADIVQEMRNPSAWTFRMRDDMGDYRRESDGPSTMRVRPAGRLAFFWRVQDIYLTMREAFDRLTHLELEAEERGVNVFIVTSVCGGTGSGIFLDMAYLARRTLLDSNVYPGKGEISGILVMPFVFPGGDSVDMESNAFAALTELDYVMENASWSMDYEQPPVRLVKFERQRPFDVCYLVDSHNENGRALRGIDEFAPMIAEAIYMQLGQEVANAVTATIDLADVQFLRQHLTDKATGKTHPTAYSSLGVATLAFPAEKLIDYCANRLTSEIIGDDLLRPDIDQAGVVRAVDAFLETNRLEAHALPETLIDDALRELYDRHIDPGRIDRSEYTTLLREIDAVINRARKTLENERLPMLTLNVGVMSARLERALVEEVERLVDEPDCGPAFADAFLLQLDVRLSTIGERLTREMDEIDLRRSRAEEDQRAAYAELEQSFIRGHTEPGKRKTYKAADLYLEEIEVDLQRQFGVGRRAVAVSILAKLADAVQAQRGRIEGLVGRLRRIEEQSRAVVESTRFDDPAGSPAREIIAPAGPETYYHQYITARPAASLAEQCGSFSRWLDADAADIADSLAAFGAALFEPINTVTIEDVIAAEGDEARLARLEEMITRSAPFWKFDPKQFFDLPDESYPRGTRIVAVEDKVESIFRHEMRRDQRLASTFDKHRLQLLQTRHGLPLFALARYEQWRVSHDKVMWTGLKPLYVLTEVRPTGDEVKRVFALAIIFGEIFTAGQFYHVRPEYEVDRPVRLGQGMASSLHSLRNDDVLWSALEKRVDHHVMEKGKFLSSSLVEEWIAAPAVNERKSGSDNDEVKMVKNTDIGDLNYVSADLVYELRKLMHAYKREILNG